MNLDEPIKENPFPKESDFMTEFLKPKQEMNVPEIPVFETESENNDADGAPAMTAAEEKKQMRRVAQASAKAIIGLIDGGTSTGCEILSDGCDAQKYRFDEDEKDDAVNAMADYLEYKGLDIPPGLTLLLVILADYLRKVGNRLQRPPRQPQSKGVGGQKQKITGRNRKTKIGAEKWKEHRRR